MSLNSEPTIISRRQGRIGRITLNRPKALNAIDHEMVCAIHLAIDSWRDDPAVHAVVIEGSGDRAFCAGGDIRQVRNMALAGNHAGIEAFFVDEYALNLAIARYPKPYIALIDGVCMGGGIGLSVHGSSRVVTDAALLAMPETGIGFFPDVGASFFLPRLRPGYGMFLGLTGAKIRGADAVYLGLATHYVSRDVLPTLADCIAESGIAALGEVTMPLPDSKLTKIATNVRCFNRSSVAAIVTGLQQIDSEWTRETLATLRLMSPSSVLWSFKLVHSGADRTLEQCLSAELALTRYVTRYPDFTEGVRAMIVDKDRAPRWHPDRLEDVDISAMEALLC